MHYLEKDLPDFVRKSMQAMVESWNKVDNGVDDPLWDCYFCEFQADINWAEVEGMITTEQADYLRTTYLRLRNFKGTYDDE